MSEPRALLLLPWPPSVNHYWRSANRTIKGRRRPIVLVSDEGLKYQADVLEYILRRGLPRAHFHGRIALRITLEMPDKRRRDIDNYLKSLLDSLTHAGVWLDDSQIDIIDIRRGEVLPPGRAIVEVTEINQRTLEV